MDAMGQPTAYQLYIEVTAPLRLNVGRLGCFDFPAGDYVYTGSARRNLEARIARHLRREKTLRWHIDYLLVAAGVRVCSVVRSEEDECLLVRRSGGTVVVPGFGASDCRAGCVSHLRCLSAAPPAA